MLSNQKSIGASNTPSHLHTEGVLGVSRVLSTFLHQSVSLMQEDTRYITRTYAKETVKEKRRLALLRDYLTFHNHKYTAR